MINSSGRSEVRRVWIQIFAPMVVAVPLGSNYLVSPHYFSSSAKWDNGICFTEFLEGLKRIIMGRVLIYSAWHIVGVQQTTADNKNNLIRFLDPKRPPYAVLH